MQASADHSQTILLPDWTWVDGALHAHLAIGLTPDGRIGWMGAPPEEGRVQRLKGRLLLPAFVNGHSHAFQRAIRGRTEYRRPGSAGDDFWSWREQMYSAALRLSPDDLEAVSRLAFLEMALAGITSVGEFHYLHHPAEGGRYGEPNELALRVARAAAEVGIELVLLRVSYGRAGYRKESNPRQVRFLDRTPEEAIEAVERLRAEGLRVGLAPHSVRALPLEWIRSLADHARRASLPLHMHVSEQPREVEECVAEHGLRPVELLEREGVLHPLFTAVHAVHLEAREVRALGEARATVCACPTTERNLGDGIVPAKELLEAKASISLGTDSQIEINPLSDARALEGNLRLRDLQRVILGRPEGDSSLDGPAARLLDCATAAGARSLALPTGRIAVGAPADLVAFDLEDPSICGARPDSLLSNVIFSGERSAVREVWAKGRQIVAEGRHPLQEEAVRAFQEVMRRLWA